MTRILVITFTRADYNSILPVVKLLRADQQFEASLIVSGTHLSSAFGHTVDQIELDGLQINERIEMPLASDSAEAVVKSVGVAMTGFAQKLARTPSDLMLLVGDRLDLLAPATAALAFRVPIAHISGGDTTEGAIDNQVRDAITKMSHLHFVAMAEHAERLRRIGEEPWRIHITGEPALDLLKGMKLLPRDELGRQLGMELKPPLVAMTYHPATLSDTSVKEESSALLSALDALPATYIMTMPNSDVGGQAILDDLRGFELTHPSARLYASLGPLRYYSLLSHADVMVGNSSSGIWESASFRLPVVNVGDRQKGRYRAANVIDVTPTAESILSGLRRAMTPDFRSSLCHVKNPYGEGDAARKIVNVLKRLKEMPPLLVKRNSISP